MDLQTWVILATLFLYFLFMLWIGLRTSKRISDLSGYILAGRNLPWFVLAFTFLATLANTSQVLGLPGFAYLNGFSFYVWVFLGQIIIWAILLPRIAVRLRALDLSTIGDFAHERFPSSWRMHYSMSVWQVVWGIFVTALMLYGGAILIETVVGIPWPIGTAIIAVVTVAYTIAGGLRAVVITDSVQWIIIIVGTAIFIPLLFWQVGSFTSFFSRYLGSQGTSPTSVASESNMPAGFTDIFTLPEAFTYLPVLLAFIMAGGLFLVIDLGFVQRMLAARNMSEGLKGTYAFFTALYLFVLVMAALGLYGRALHPNVENTDTIIILLAQENLPIIGTALFLTAVVAAAMSTISTYLNAASSIMVRNIIAELRPSTSQAQQLVLTRGFTAVVCVLAIALTPFAASGGIVPASIAVQILFTIAVLPTVLLGCYWKRLTERAAFWSSTIAPIATLILMFADGGPTTVFSSPGFFGIPVFFWGMTLAFALAVGLSITDSHSPERVSPAFREIFEGRVSRFPNTDLKIIGVASLVLLAVVVYKETFGSQAAFPPLSGPLSWLTDVGFVAISLFMIGASFYLLTKLIRYIREEVAPQAASEPESATQGTDPAEEKTTKEESQ